MLRTMPSPVTVKALKSPLPDVNANRFRNNTTIHVTHLYVATDNVAKFGINNRKSLPFIYIMQSLYYIPLGLNVEPVSQIVSYAEHFVGCEVYHAHVSIHACTCRQIHINSSVSYNYCNVDQNWTVIL